MVRVDIDINLYHTKKAQFKKLMNSLGIVWVGTMQEPKWQSDTVVIYGHFERDMVENVSLKGYFEVEGVGDQANQIVNCLVVNCGGVVSRGEELTRRLAEYTAFQSIYTPSDYKLSSMPELLKIRTQREWTERRDNFMIEHGIVQEMLDGVYPIDKPLPEIPKSEGSLPEVYPKVDRKEDREMVKIKAERAEEVKLVETKGKVKKFAEWLAKAKESQVVDEPKTDGESNGQ